MSFRNASLRTFKLTAKLGTSTPKRMPKISPSSTCTNSDLNIPPSPVLGGAAGDDRAAVDMGFLGPAVLHGLGTIPSNDHAKGKLSSAQFCALIVRQPLVGCRILMLSK